MLLLTLPRTWFIRSLYYNCLSIWWARPCYLGSVHAAIRLTMRLLLFLWHCFVLWIGCGRAWHEVGGVYAAGMLGLEAWPRHRGLSRPKFCGLDLGLEGPGLGLEGPGLVEAGAEATMETCVLFHAKQCHKSKSKRIVSRIAACINSYDS